MSKALQGKIAIVTGASSGIGAAVAVALANEGAKVAAVGRDEGRLLQTIEEIRQAGGEAEKVVADMTEDGAADRIVEEAVSHFGGITTLVNCAGAFEMARLEDGLETLDNQWRVNVRAPFDLTRAAIPHLRPGGSVIFFGSATAVIGSAGSSAYAAAKGALPSMARALAIEEAPNQVRVNCIIPGLVRTRMNEAYVSVPKNEEALKASIPLGRVGSVEDIAPAVVYLASDGSSFMTAQSLVLDGGLTAV